MTCIFQSVLPAQQTRSIRMISMSVGQLDSPASSIEGVHFKQLGANMPFRVCWLFWEALGSPQKGLPTTLAQAGPSLPSRRLSAR